MSPRDESACRIGRAETKAEPSYSHVLTPHKTNYGIDDGVEKCGKSARLASWFQLQEIDWFQLQEIEAGFYAFRKHSLEARPVHGAAHVREHGPARFQLRYPPSDVG